MAVSNLGAHETRASSATMLDEVQTALVEPAQEPRPRRSVQRRQDLLQFRRLRRGKELRRRSHLMDAPGVHETTRPATLRAKLISCVTTSSVMPFAASDSTIFNALPTSCRSSAKVISPRSTTPG